MSSNTASRAFLDHLGDVDVEVLLSVLKTTTLEAGADAITAGKPHDSLLLVEWGELTVLVDEHEVSRIGPGEIAGEVGLLSPGLATATVRATQQTMLHVLTGESLQDLWRDHPSIASSMIQGATRVIATRIRAIEGDVDKLPDHNQGLIGILGRLFGRAA
ncbi:MAG: cyclic nucleotide-binding domain-containing protein [Proteobacteria bacterium]|nr:cyclic nucleotide-binding domain-containing protein [Pseudomonadota bacterium]